MKSIFYILFLVLFLGCNSKERDELHIDAYKKHTKNINKNKQEHIVEQEVSSLLYTCRYIPVEELILKRNPSISESDFAALIDETGSNNIVVEYNIKVPGGAGTDALKYASDGIQTYHERLMKVNQNGAAFFHIDTDKGRLACKQLTMDRTYGMSDQVKFMLYFSGEVDDYERLTCVFEDEIYNQGTVKHDLTNQINNTPKLKLTKK